MSLRSKENEGGSVLPFIGQLLYTKEGWIVLSNNEKYTVANFDKLNVADHHDTKVEFTESDEAHYLLPFGSPNKICLIFIQTEWTKRECELCNGKGYVNTIKYCENCHGHGVIFILTIKS